jgi:hypothetical protein
MKRKFPSTTIFSPILKRVKTYDISKRQKYEITDENVKKFVNQTAFQLWNVNVSYHFHQTIDEKQHAAGFECEVFCKGLQNELFLYGCAQAANKADGATFACLQIVDNLIDLFEEDQARKLSERNFALDNRDEHLGFQIVQGERLGETISTEWTIFM